MGAHTRRGAAMGGTMMLALVGGLIAISSRQTPVVHPVDESALREYAGVYQWGPDSFVYLQMWDEFSGFGKPNWWRLTSPVMCGRCIRPTVTSFSPAPAPRCPPRWSRASRFSATAPAGLSR